MTGSGIIMTCFIGCFFVIGLLSFRMERQQKQLGDEKKAQKQSEENIKKQEKALFQTRVTDLLPDTDAAIKLLITQHSWDEIIGTIGLNQLHIKLLTSIYFDNNLDLPNMQSNQYGQEEKHVARVVRSITTTNDDIGFYGVDSFAQEPTVEMLRKLVASDLVSTSEPITQNQRSFVCQLTPRGKSMFSLNSRFQNIDKSFRVRNLLSAEERKFITSVLNKSISDGMKDQIVS